MIHEFYGLATVLTAVIVLITLSVGSSSDSDEVPGVAKSFLKKKPAAEVAAPPPDASKFLKAATVRG